MRIRNYQAETVSRALRMAKEELGPDAIVLKTTQIPPEGGLRRAGKKVFQVTACVDDGMLPSAKTSRQTTSSSQPTFSDSSLRAFGEILSELRRDVKCLVNSGRMFAVDKRISPENLQYYVRLTSQEVDPDLAERVVSQLAALDLNENDETAVRDAMLGIIKRDLTENSEIRLFAGRQTRVALVGPPGSGKSALTAKLASHFVVDKKAKVTLVSLDDFKPTAADELERYGKALDVRCIDVESLTCETDSSGVVLIDTAGVPVGADDEMERLQEELSRASIDEIHLVLPAFCRWDDLRRWYEFFKPLNPTATALTFLDQTRTYGAAISLAILEGARLSYFSTGRTSAAHLEPADASRLADKLIGVSGGQS